jgi:hypothetical protein
VGVNYDKGQNITPNIKYDSGYLLTIQSFSKYPVAVQNVRTL